MTNPAVARSAIGRTSRETLPPAAHGRRPLPWERPKILAARPARGFFLCRRGADATTRCGNIFAKGLLLRTALGQAEQQFRQAAGIVAGDVVFQQQFGAERLHSKFAY